MNIKEYLKIAYKYDKKDKIILGYTQDNKVYFAILDEYIVDRVCFKQASKSNGCGVVLAHKPLTRKHKQALLEKSTYLCDMVDFMVGYNKGDSFEKHIRNYYNLPHKHDNLSFFDGCDMVVNGVGYSIKWENAQLYPLKVLDRLANA